MKFLILLIFLPIFETLDFDEITYRKFPAIKIASQVLKMIQEQPSKLEIFVDCDGNWNNETGFRVHREFKNFENSTIDVAAIRHFEDSSVLYFEIFSESPTYYRLAFYAVLKEKDWRNTHVMDITCKKWKNQVMGWNYDLKLKVINIVDLYNFFEERQNSTKLYGREDLSEKFAENFEMKFCDGSKFKYLFKESDGIVDSEVLYHDSVDFHRKGNDAEKGKFVALSQVYMTVNGRKLQIEHNDDENKFTKGREYPCD